MIGTVNQIAWAVQIRAQVDAEFDRVLKVLESVATKQSPDDGTHLQAIIGILDDKRGEVMGNEQAGYFIHDWQELRDQVRQLIIGRYSDAVTELNAWIGRSSRAEYEGLRRAVEETRKNSAVALKTLDTFRSGSLPRIELPALSP